MIFFNFVIEGLPVNFQYAGCFADVPTHFFQNFFNMYFFQLFQAVQAVAELPAPVVPELPVPCGRAPRSSGGRFAMTRPTNSRTSAVSRKHSDQQHSRRYRIPGRPRRRCSSSACRAPERRWSNACSRGAGTSSRPRRTTTSRWLSPR